jgi:RHS repeat-associated protein
MDNNGWIGIEGNGFRLQLTESGYSADVSDKQQHYRFQKYLYQYDDAGRLKLSAAYTPITGGFLPFIEYSYNYNSQVSGQNLGYNLLSTSYSYNSRNWISAFDAYTIFNYTLSYYQNGNISNQYLTGDYRNNFTNTSELSFDYTYDKSNRLLKQDNKPGNELNYDLFNTYDKDGNHLTLQRYGDGSSLLDNFNYEYFNSTNRLKNIRGMGYDEYSYDYNGNDTMDLLNSNTYMKYDFRNLLIEYSNTASLSYTLWTRYYYDEAGNRIRKYVLKTDFGNSPPPEDWENPGSAWSVINNEYYVRDVNGKEIAIYNGSELSQWNVYGLDNVGKINPDRSRNFYIKDHLGSVRVMLDENRNIVSSQDYDCWGYQLENRVYQIEYSKYKFTGKERDWESLGYDYFGARYYVSRIANWTSVDPLLEKHIGWTPYNYVLRNPMRLVDPDGNQVQVIAGIEVAIEMAAVAGIVYGTFKLAEHLAEAYEQYNQTTLSPELTQEKIETTNEPNVANPNYESISKTKKKVIKGQIETISEHLDKIEGKNPYPPNPSDQNKNDWKKEIKDAIKNIKDAAKRLKKDPQQVIKEMINKGKLNEEYIKDILNRLSNQNIKF